MLVTGVLLTVLGFLLSFIVVGIPLLIVGIPMMVIGSLGGVVMIPAIGFDTAKALTKTIIKNRAKIAYGLFHKPTPEETKEARAKLRNVFLRKEVKST